MNFFPRAAVFLVFLLFALTSPIWSEAPAAERTDRYGDALPLGAVARLGSMRLRHDNPPGLLAFAADNKTLAVLTVHDKVNRLWLWNGTTGAKIRTVDVGKEPYTAATFSRDGRFLALSAGDDFILMDTATGQLVRRLQPLRQRLTSLAVSPDGKVLATSCARNRLDEPSDVVLRETAGGKELARLQDHKTDVETLAFSGDGRLLFSCSGERKGVAGSRFPDTIPAAVCVWDVASRQLRRRIRPNGVNVVFAADGKRMACTDPSGGIHLWDLETERERAKLDGDWRGYLFSPDGKTLITGSQHEMLTKWDAATGKKLRTFAGHLGKGVSPAAISSDGKMLATIGEPFEGDTSVRLWDVATGEERQPFVAHRDSVSCLAFAPDGKTVVSGSKDTTLRVWDAASGEARRVYAKHRAAITTVALSPDGKTVASGDEANVVHLWNPDNGAQLHRLAVPPDRGPGQRTGIRCLAFTADGKTLIAGSMALNTEAPEITLKGLLAAWDVASDKEVQARKEEGCCSVALTADGRYLASGALNARNLFAPEETLLLRRWDSNKLLARIEGGEGGMFQRVIFSPDGKILATHLLSQSGGLFGGGSRKARSQLWEVATGKAIATLPRGGRALAFSPDGKFLAAASLESDKIWLRSTVTGDGCGELPGHPGRVECCAFSADGRRLATSGADQTILVWDVSRFQLDRTLPRVEAARKNAEKLWTDVQGDDASRAYRAIAVLTAMPEQSLPLLRQHLKPVAGVPAAALERAIKALDSEDFAVRQRGRLELETAGELAQPALRRVLAGQPSLEMRRRVEELLARVDTEPLSAKHVCLLRALTVLEWIGTEEARQLLKRLAAGAPGAFLTEEAKGSLQRLHRRRGGGS